MFKAEDTEEIPVINKFKKSLALCFIFKELQIRHHYQWRSQVFRRPGQVIKMTAS
jgi:hypothetical protein